MDLSKKLTRSMNDRILFGVCGGLGTYTGVDSTVIRLVLVFLTVITGFFPFVLAYVVAAVIVPPDGPVPQAVNTASPAPEPTPSAPGTAPTPMAPITPAAPSTPVSNIPGATDIIPPSDPTM